MVRKVGANTPGVAPPELYDITGDMRQRIQQDVQQASSASMQAFGSLAQAQAANSARMLQNAETAEKGRYMQAQAEAENAKGTGVLGGVAQLMTGFVGGLVAQEEVNAKRQALEMERADKDRKYALDVAQFQHGVEKDKHEFQIERDKANLDQLGSLVDASLAEAEAQIESAFVGATHQQGITYAEKMFETIRTQYSGLFEKFPALEARFNMGQAKIRQNIVQRYADVYRDEIETERKLAVNVMNQKANIALATRFQELSYASGQWTPEQANQQVNALISEGMSIAQQDPQFQAAVAQNPGLMLRFYDNLLSTIGTNMGEYAKKNAEITSTVASIREVNAVISQLGDTTDPAVVAQLQEFIASKGLPQWNDPNSWGTSIISTANNRKALLDSMEGTSTAATQDPLFGLDTAGHRAVANVNKAELLFNAANLRDGWDMGNAIAYTQTQASAAKKRGDYTSEAYWQSIQSHLTEYQDASKNYGGMKDELRKLDKEFAEMTRPQQDTTVLPDVGSATRVPVTGEKLQPRYSQAEIQALDKKRLELRTQITEYRQLWLGRGIDLDNTKDDAPLKNLKNGAAPYIDQMNQGLMQRGAVPDTGTRTYDVRPQQQSYAPPGQTANFSGGRVPTETVAQGQTGTLPFAGNAAPLTPSVPLRGGTATAPGIGVTPFKAGKVSFSGGERGQLNFSSSDPRITSPIGGKVEYVGGTQTMGNVIVIKTSDGNTEVYSNVNTMNVKRGDNVQPGVVIGTASRLGFQVWQNSDSVRALRMEQPRNILDPIKYLNGVTSLVQLPRGTGVLDATTAPPTIVAGGNTNMFAGQEYTIFGDILWDKRTGKTRKLTQKEFSYFYPNGLRTADQNVRQKNNAQAQAQAMGLQAFGGAQDIVSFGKTLQARGWNVGQHPAFGKVGGHAKNSYHYRGLAVDVTPGKGATNMQALADEVFANREVLGIAEIIHNGKIWKPGMEGWQPFKGDPHNGHVHIAFKNAKFKAGFSEGSRPSSLPPNHPNMASSTSKPPVATFNTGNAQHTANIRAFADGIAKAEGTDGFFAYDTYFTGQRFDSSQPHPERIIQGSSAAGRYQFMPKTWRSIWGGENRPMTPANQDAGFIILLKRRGAYEDVLAGRFVEAYRKVSNEWASVKGNSYTYKGKPQGKFSPEELANYAGERALSYVQSTQPARNSVTNRPVRVARAAPQASVYPPNKAGANYGYAALANDKGLAKHVYDVAQKMGVPAQWVADALAHSTNGKFNARYELDKVERANIKDINQFAAASAVPVQSLGQYAGRTYSTATLPQRRTPVKNPAPTTSPQPSSKPSSKPSPQYSPQLNLPQRYTPVQQQDNRNVFQKAWDWVRGGYHKHPRSNCPTCQQMQRDGNFKPHSH